MKKNKKKIINQFLEKEAWAIIIFIFSICIFLSIITFDSREYPSGLSNQIPINNFLSNKWYLDDINDKIFVRGSRKLAREVLEVDAKVVDGVVNLT